MFSRIKIHSKSLLKSLFLIVIFITCIAAYAQQATTYEDAIMQADDLYRQGKFYDAKAYYQMALRFTPGDTYATEQISVIVDKLKEQQLVEEEYYEFIDLADVLFEEQAWDRALAEYRKALRVIPTDEYARDQVDKILRKKAEEKDKIISFNMAMQEGNALLTDNKFEEAIEIYKEAQRLLPERPEPPEKIELAKRLMNETSDKLVVFKEEIEQGERYLLVNNYIAALQHFETAQMLFPKNTNAKKKIKEIAPLAEKQQAYNLVVEEADNMYVSKDFAAAKKKYEEAEKTWPENTYSADMISRIDEMMAEQMKNLDKNYQKSIRAADSLLALKEYKLAKSDYNMALTLKPDEGYPKSKIGEIDAYFADQQKQFEANYASMIASADKLFEEQQYMQAKEQYEFALTIKPDDTYPKQRLQDIDKQLDLIEEQKRLNATYDDLIAEADNLYQNGHYDLAINKYAEAQTVKSVEDYPQQRIAELRALLADAEKQREIDEKYGQLVIVATRLLKEDKLEDSKAAYQNALELKPGDLIAIKEINRIDSIVDARIRQAEIEKQYKALIASGDSLLALLEFEPAIETYTNAININPGDPLADQKRLTARRMKQNHERAIARQKAYDEAILEGDKLFAEENFELAKTEYEKAVELKSDEPYPRDQIIDINSILKKLEAEREERFKLAITKADNLFEQAIYSEAVIQYKIANSIKPDEPYPGKRIMECNSLIEEQNRKLRAQYDIAIADADKLYAAKIYDKAINTYKEAEQIIPDESYPREMIDKITKYIEENAIVDIIKEVIAINANTEERFEFEPVLVSARKSNYIVVKARNLSDKEFKIIFGYGSSKGKSGGFVVQVPQSDEYNDFIIRVGNQYKWFSEDNNWISVYPENGDIEIKMIKISSSN